MFFTAATSRSALILRTYFSATNKQTWMIMRAKGRQKKDGQPPGEKHAMAKLTEAQAIEIIRRVRGGEFSGSLAHEYPVSARTIRRIAWGERWPHLQARAA
jgi:hypothetical protein